MISGALAALLVFPRQGTPPDLAQAILGRKWDPAADGPIVAFALQGGRPPVDASGPPMKTIKVGGLTAVVPRTMTVIDSRPRQAPNLYDGLPQTSKMLYLLSLLTPEQWTRAAGEGLSLADCRGEQTAVFESILPDPFLYEVGTVQNNNSVVLSDKPEDQKALTGPERRAIRLRVARHIELNLALRAQEGYTSTNFEEGWKPGRRLAYVRDEPTSEFGHRFFVTSPNVPRPSALDPRDARLGAAVTLKLRDSVPALLARVSAATGLRLVADPHFRNAAMNEVGDSASARDLLAAAALGVAGVFRRVGNGYVLTNDLEGMAAHQARLGAWEETVQTEVRTREARWRGAILAAGGLGRTGFTGAAYEGLTESERANLVANDRNGASPAYLPVTGSSPAIANAMKTYSGGNDIDRTRIGLYSSLRMEIVLPDGSTTASAPDLGQTDQFDRNPNAGRPPNPPAAMLPLAPTARLAGLVLHADASAAASALVARVARLGVGVLWLETRSPEALAAAVAAGRAKGVKVSLVLRPWTLGPGEVARDPDRTAMGLHGKALLAGEAELAPWQQYWEYASAFAPEPRERLAPLDPGLPARTAALVRLASMPGLASVALLDLYGAGYAKASSRSFALFSPTTDGFVSYGYSDAQRAAFFAANGIDPLDVENPGIRTDVDLRPAWSSGDMDEATFDAWQKARGVWAHDAALALARALAAVDPARPLLLPGQLPENHIASDAAGALVAWTSGTELPVAPSPFTDAPPARTVDFEVTELRDDADPPQRNRVAASLQKRLAASGAPLVIDLSAVPPERLEAVLARWLKDK